MSGSNQDGLVRALRQERDSYLEEARFERGRARQANQRCDQLRSEMEELRLELKNRLSGPPAARGGDPESEVDQRLRLALDTNWRLEKDRSRLEKAYAELKQQLVEQQRRNEWLTGRIKALEGRLRLIED